MARYKQLKRTKTFVSKSYQRTALLKVGGEGGGQEGGNGSNSNLKDCIN